MGFDARVICDSTAGGVRLTTMVTTFPRFILAEMNTHRVFSRNSASSRAIPVMKRIEQVEREPFVPEAFAHNKAGMQAGDLFTDDETRRAQADWLSARDEAVRCAKSMLEAGVHKQWANRLLEPWSWHTVVLSGTDWLNFWALRCNAAAQPEMQTIAYMMRAAYNGSTPKQLQDGEWHLPFISDTDRCSFESKDLTRLSVARAAAVSYERHMLEDPEKDFARYDKLASSGHMSPFEHQAMVDMAYPGEFSGNFRYPFVQFRKTIPGEDVFTGGAA